MRIAYLVHNLADPAVGKRVRILAAFGDRVVPIGFHRDDRVIEAVEGFATIDLGRTFDGVFRQRIAMVLKCALRSRHWAEPLRHCDVVIARNLEMLALAALARWRYRLPAKLVYECLDVHRLLLKRGVAGAAMRLLERLLLRKTALLVVSSPAFVREYFEPVHGRGPGNPPVLLVENKFVAPRQRGPDSERPAPLPPPSGPPWRIGWFGMIRCRKSLDLLCGIASRRPGLIEVIIRGRPSYSEFADFHAQVARTPGVSFGGPYRPTDLADLYAGVHFNWTIDHFEEGANSRWLLPNRIYEGGVYHAVPVALATTETSRWLRRIGIGVHLEDDAAVEEFLLGMTEARYAALAQASRAAPADAFLADEGDSARLLDALRSVTVSCAVSRRAPMPIELDIGHGPEPRDDAAV